MKIVLASHNREKISEMQSLFKKTISDEIQILSLSDIGFCGQTEETGLTFEENALIKAKAAASYGYIVIADDSGLEVDALNGAPGIYSARYSGGSDKENNDKLLNELRDIPFEKRTARFVCVIVCFFPGFNEYLAVRGCCEGFISDSPKGDGGFGYDPLFYFKTLRKTFAELSPDEKNAVSHRGAAMRALAAALPEAMNKYAP